MKVLQVITIALLLASCGPSAKEIAATAEMAQAQTLTAAPTRTPTLTPTPTSTPTITPSPTPSIPNVQGRIQLNFIPVDDKTIIPQPPHDVAMYLIHGEEEIVVQADNTDGSFSIDLEPGLYTINSVTINNEALKLGDSQILAVKSKFIVPWQPCFQAGTISFYMFRLPPGSLEQQSAMTQEFTKGVSTLLVYAESGGVILPALSEISGTGNCPDLPNLSNGYDWRYLPESLIAIPSPSDWFFLSEQDRPNWSYFISQEEIIDGGFFQTGLSIYVILDESKSAEDFVNEYPPFVINQGNITNSSEIETWEDGILAYSEFQVEANGQLFDFTSHYLLVGNKDTNAQYIFIFEGPTDQWDDAWADGKILMENIQFFNSE